MYKIASTDKNKIGITLIVISLIALITLVIYSIGFEISIGNGLDQPIIKTGFLSFLYYRQLIWFVALLIVLLGLGVYFVSPTKK